jgi:hypothetical protein
MSSKPKSARRVGKSFTSIEPKDRRNSQMIRRLLYDTIAHEFERDCNQASTGFAEATKSTDMRAYDRLIPAHSLYKAANDHHAITFQTLNALARYYKVPISVILIFTRIRDELEYADKRDHSEASHILAAMRAVIGDLETRVSSVIKSDCDIFDWFGHSDFKDYVDTYRSSLKSNSEQPQLPLD